MLNESYIKVLHVDLTAQKVRIARREDLFYLLGGVGVAAALYEEAMRPDLDPLDPDQPIVFAIGPLNTIFPVVTKAVAMFRSPLNRELGESHAGGRIGLAMRYAGYDALVLTGRASHPTYLYIDSTKVRFRDATPLWGLKADETGRILREQEGERGHRTIMRIGPAGEKLIPYALVNIETYRHFGRLGLGAVFGSKHLKALFISGDKLIPIPNVREYNRVYTEVYRRVTETEAMKKYHEQGTPFNVLPLSDMGGLPTRNLQAGSFEGAADISGEAFAENNLMRKQACAGCPIGCIHVALYRRSFGQAGEYEVQSALVAYDYELVYALGSLLGISDRNGILGLIDTVGNRGLDAIATGVTLAWATEAMHKGLIQADELGTELHWGDVAGYIAAVKAIVREETELTRALAQGPVAAAARYGGSDFVLALGGNPMAGYHTGYGSLVGQLVGMRHSHVDNAGYSLDQRGVALTDEEIVDGLLHEETDRCIVNSLCICLFARKIYDRATVLAALRSIGIEMDEAGLDKLARETMQRRIRVKRAFGFDFRALTAPARYYETPTMHGRLDPARLDRLIQLYADRIDTLMS